MPNYAGLADFLVPLRESMKAYNEGQTDRAKQLLEQVNSLMDAYETQQRAQYQSAQAYRTQALTPYEIEYKKQQAGAQEALGGYRQEQATTEKETRPFDVGYAEQRPITEKARQGLYEAQTEVAKSKVATPEELQNIVINTPELRAILGDKESYTKAEIDSGLKVLRDRALNAKDAKQLDYIDARIDYTNKLGEVADARATGAGGLGKPLTTLDLQRQMRIDAYKYALSQGMNPLQAYNSVSTRFGISSISGLISDLNEQNFMETDPVQKANNQRLINSLRGMQEQMIGGLQTKEQRQQTETAKQGVAVFDYDTWVSTDPNKFVLEMRKQQANGVKQIKIVDKKGTLKVQFNYDPATGEWTQSMKPQPKAQAKPTQTAKPAQKPAETPKKTTTKPASQSDKDYQDAINFFKKNPMR